MVVDEGGSEPITIWHIGIKKSGNVVGWLSGCMEIGVVEILKKPKATIYSLVDLQVEVLSEGLGWSYRHIFSWMFSVNV